MKLLASLLAALTLAPAASALEVRAVPARISFGDPVVVTATGSGRVELDLGAWSALAAPSTATSKGMTTVSQRVACLVEACVPGVRGRSVALPAATERGARATATILVDPRVDATAVAADKAAYRRDTTARSPRDHGSVVLLLGSAGAVLLFLAALLAVPGLRRESAPRRSTQDSLARALRLLRESGARPAADRRRAADLVGRLAPEVAGPARRVAWARPEPRPEDVEDLAGLAEESA